MKLPLLIATLMAAAGLAGCVVVPDHNYRYGVYDKPGQGTHCPPGQAKKGNCYPDGGFCPPGLQKQGRC